MMQLRIFARLAISVAALAGCATDESDTLTTDTAFLSCAPWVCGSNSPIVDNYGFHDLNANGLRNEGGFELVRVARGGANYDIRVRAAEIYLFPKTAGGSVIRGTAVKDAVLIVRQRTTGARYEIEIAEVLKTPMWAKLPGEPIPSIFTYQFRWRVEGSTGHSRNVCSNPGSESEPGMDAFHTIVFEGDRIDEIRKRDVRVDTDWFNLGCAGSATSKLQLTGHTEAAKVLGYVTTLDERTTMLKMLTGDYCGTGEPFTVPGQPLRWRDDNGWMTYSSLTNRIEAHWGPNGATCLDTPRLNANPTPAGIDTFGEDDVLPNMRPIINSACATPIPRCTVFSPSPGGGPVSTPGITSHLVSANPT
ncbi:MAG: ADYC domain-containing protein [bacterium]